MKNKVIATLVFISSLIFLNCIAMKASAANCGDTNSDGTTETACVCGDTVIGASGYTYQLTGDLGPCAGNGLTIGSASTTIDGNNYSIIGSNAKNSYGIYNNAIDNATVENVTTTDFYNGIYFSGGANNCTITNVNATSNVYSGIYLVGTSPSGNSLTNNTVNSNYVGINLESASNTLTGNSMSGNIMANIYTDPLNSTIDTSNTVEGKPVYYLYGTAANSYYSGQVYDGTVGDIGMFWCVNCKNVTVKNATLSVNNYYGVLFSNTVTSTIDNVISNSNYYGGIYIQSGSYGNTITNNTVKYNNNQGGIYFNNSPNNTVSGNTVKDNPGYGIYFTTSANNNTLTNNVISGNSKGNIRAVTTALINSIDTSNTVEGKPVYYLYGTAANSYYNGQVYDGSTGDIGMFWCINCNNVTVKNATLAANNYDAIYFNNTGTSTIDNVVVPGTFKYGIHFDGSTNNTISNSTIRSNFGYGVYLATSNSNTFSGNTFLNNINGIYNSGTTNTFSSNIFLNNIYNKALVITDPNRIKSIGGTASTTIAMYNLNGGACSSDTTPSCTATITASPSESVLSTVSSNQVAAEFSLSKAGTYSMDFAVTDSNGNITKRRLAFLAGSTSSQTTRYYLRSVVPTHGQPGGSDLRSLAMVAPTTTENWNCGNWVQNSAEVIPNYPLSSISSIDINSWYRQLALTGATIGAERFSSFANTSNATGSIAYSGDYTWTETNLTNLNWQMDYPQSWYWLTVKLTGSANGTYPNWKTTAAQPSYADIVHQYTSSPIIKAVSNENIIVISATAPSSSTSTVTIVLDGAPDATLDGTGMANVTIDSFKRPFSGYTSTINADGTTIVAVTGITSTSSISSVALDITPNAGSVAVSNLTWGNASSTKQWTESGVSGVSSAEHKVGDLQTDYYYTVKIDGVEYGKYKADSLGEISFNYAGGYSTHTFSVSVADPETTASATTNGASYTFGELSHYNVLTNLSCVDRVGGNCLSIFYCMDANNTCTPTTIYSAAIEIPASINPVYLRYYSIDSYGVSETVKSKLVNSLIVLPGGAFGGEITNKLVKKDAKEVKIVDSNNDKGLLGVNKFAKLLVLLKYRLGTIIKGKGLNNINVIGNKAKNEVVTTLPAVLLEFGMIDNNVSILQRRLRDLGYFTHPYITRYFGPATRDAVIKFQKDRNIKPMSGVYGPKTRAALEEKKY